MNKTISRSIEKNQKKIMMSKLELATVVKKDGKFTLEPKIKESD